MKLSYKKVSGSTSICVRWMWLFTGNLSTRDPSVRSWATMPPSQTLDSCVFHCKSAMKSSTLIWEEWMWDFQLCNVRECNVGGPVSSKALKSKRLFLNTMYFHAFMPNFLSKCLLWSPSSADISHCLSIHFHSQPKPYFPSLPSTVKQIFWVNFQGVVRNPSTVSQSGRKIKNKYFLLKWRHVNHQATPGLLSLSQIRHIIHRFKEGGVVVVISNILL